MKHVALRCLGLLSLLGSIGVTHAQWFWNNTAFPYDNTPVAWNVDSIWATEDLGAMVAQGMVISDKSLVNSFLKIFGFATPEYEGIPKALIYIKFIINILLWLVAFIALVMVIYSFYIMFFTEDSKGIEKVKKNLTGVAIALVILGLSRIIVSFIFDFYQTKLLNPPV